MKKTLALLVAVAFLANAANAQKENYIAKHVGGGILHLKFSRDASKLLSYSSGEQYLFLWDVRKKQLDWERPISFIQKSDEYYTLNAIAWSPDNRLIATGSANGTIQLWDASNGNFLWRTDAAKRDITAVSFSPDSKLIAATSSSDKSDAVKIFNVSDGTLKNVFVGNPCTGIALAFDDSNQRLILGNLDGNIAIWNLNTGSQLADYATPCREMRTYDWHTSFSVDLSLSARQLSADEVVIKNVRDSQIVVSTKASDSKVKTAVSSTAQVGIVSEYGGFRVFDLKTGKNWLLDDFESGDVFDLSDDGQLFAQMSGYKTAIRITDLKGDKVWFLDGKPLQVIKPNYDEIKLGQERDVRIAEVNRLKQAREKDAALFARKFRDKVYITFEHYGDMSDPGNKRMLETNELKESKLVKQPADATAVWLRLHNDSPLPIRIPTESMYLPDPNCFYLFQNGEKLFGLCADKEIGLWHGVKDSKGKWVPYGFDFGSSANLLPSSSVLFPVPISIWNKGFSIVFSFSFQNVKASENDRTYDYGEKIELKFNQSNLSKR